MSEKQCTRCKCLLLLKYFRPNLRTGQLTKSCAKCLDAAKALCERVKCPHGKQKSRCQKCGGTGICEHDRQRLKCKDCGGSQICEHNRQRYQCKDCGGSQICPHGRIKSRCIKCGGSQICHHGRQRSRCKDCGGASICKHNKHKWICPICDPAGHLASVVSCRVRKALKNNKEMRSTVYLGCSIDALKKHIENQFVEGMSWENYGSEWHIDHKIPLKYHQDGKPPTLEKVGKRLHYLNTQPMWASENIAKGNRFISV